MLFRFESVKWKGGALAPPLERLLSLFRLAAPTVPQRRDCGGRETSRKP
jgi:hypothetical protein